MRLWFFGETVAGLKIPAYTFGPETAKTEVLLMGGIHGDEPEGTIAGNGLLWHFMQNFPYNIKVHLIPTVNLEGMVEHQRTNGNGVDLNRNLPTKDWKVEAAQPRYNPGPSANSEPENKAIVKFLEERKIKYIISLHSWKPMLNINGDCRGLAETIAKKTKYIITEDIGYPTPGSLGTYAGFERQIPTLTYEIERGLKAREILELHVPAILDGLKFIEDQGK